MGLAERRGVKQFQDNRFPQFKTEIDEAAGFPVDLQVAWDTLAAEDYAHLYDEAFPKVYFTPLVEALRAITIDEMGKQALREGLKKVVVRYSGNYEISFAGGTLTLDHHPVSNLDDVNDRKNELQKVLEKGL